MADENLPVGRRALESLGIEEGIEEDEKLQTQLAPGQGGVPGADDEACQLL